MLLLKYLLRYFKQIRMIINAFGLSILQKFLPKPIFILVTALYPIISLIYKYAKNIYAFIGLLFIFAVIDSYNIFEYDNLFILFWMTWEVMKSWGFKFIDRLFGSNWSINTSDIKVSISNPKTNKVYNKNISNPFQLTGSSTLVDNHRYNFTDYTSRDNYELKMSKVEESTTWKTYLFYGTIAIVAIGSGYILYSNWDSVSSYITTQYHNWFDVNNGTNPSGGRGGPNGSNNPTSA